MWHRFVNTKGEIGRNIPCDLYNEHINRLIKFIIQNQVMWHRFVNTKGGIGRNIPCDLSQRGNSPFVYRDGTGWPASLPYIQKIRVSVAIGIRSGIRLHERVPIVKIWRSSKNDQNRTMGKSLKL